MGGIRSLKRWDRTGPVRDDLVRDGAKGVRAGRIRSAEVEVKIINFHMTEDRTRFQGVKWAKSVRNESCMSKKRLWP